MACVNEKGQLSPAGKKLLGSLAVESLTTQDISKNSGLPIFKVRSNLREMLNAELIIEENNQYKISEKGKQILEKNNLVK
jgi:predicted transcriptional regulator